MSLVNIVGGTLLLAFGRKIFWFFVAATGFYAGYEVATRYLDVKLVWVALLIALGIGLVGALLAYFFQKLAVGAAGFFAGAYLASRLSTQFAAQLKGYEWLLILIGGIIGIILMAVIFEWALIILSSLAGAILVVASFKLAIPLATIVGVILFVLGTIFQAGLSRRDRRRKRAES